MLNYEPELAEMLGHYIKERRQKQKINQYEVAKGVNCSAQFYGRIEKGTVLPPRATLVSLITLLELDQMVVNRIFKSACVSYVGKVYESSSKSKSRSKKRA